jgi:hypothetical protein
LEFGKKTTCGQDRLLPICGKMADSSKSRSKGVEAYNIQVEVKNAVTFLGGQALPMQLLSVDLRF